MRENVQSIDGDMDVEDKNGLMNYDSPADQKVLFAALRPH